MLPFLFLQVSCEKKNKANAYKSEGIWFNPRSLVLQQSMSSPSASPSPSPAPPAVPVEWVSAEYSGGVIVSESDLQLLVDPVQSAGQGCTTDRFISRPTTENGPLLIAASSASSASSASGSGASSLAQTPLQTPAPSPSRTTSTTNSPPTPPELVVLPAQFQKFDYSKTYLCGSVGYNFGKVMPATNLGQYSLFFSDRLISYYGINLDVQSGEISGVPSRAMGVTKLKVSRYSFLAPGVFAAADTAQGNEEPMIVAASAPPQPRGQTNIVRFAYRTSSPTYVSGKAIATNIPELLGGPATEFSLETPLPEGLSLSRSSGRITGTPADVLDPIVYKTFVQAKNSQSAMNTSIEMRLVPSEPTSLRYSESNKFSLEATLEMTALQPRWAGGAPRIFAVVPPLPAGLNLDPVTGVISGKPEQVLKTSISGHVISGANATGFVSRAIQITIKPQAIAAITYPLSSYSFDDGEPIPSILPSLNGGLAESFSISPALPRGVFLNSETGEIFGTPAAVSSLRAYTVRAVNDSSSVTTRIQIQVGAKPPRTLIYPIVNASYFKNIEIANNAPILSGGQVQNFQVSPALPAGLKINRSTGVLSGTPTLVTPRSTYTVTGQNSLGQVSIQLHIEVLQEPVKSIAYSKSAVTLIVDKIYERAARPTTAGGVPTFFSINPNLPQGLRLNQSDGTISGSMPRVKEFTSVAYTITAGNSSGSASTQLILAAKPLAPLYLSYSSGPSSNFAGFVSQSIIPLTPNDSGDIANYSILPALPIGLVLNPETGVISGAPIQHLPPTQFVVTGSNLMGSVTTSLSLNIIYNVQFVGSPIQLTMRKPINVPSPYFAILPQGREISYFRVRPNLPRGLSLSSKGELQGTPTAFSLPTDYTVELKQGSVIVGTTRFNLHVPLPPSSNGVNFHIEVDGHSNSESISFGLHSRSKSRQLVSKNIRIVNDDSESLYFDLNSVQLPAGFSLRSSASAGQITQVPAGSLAYFALDFDKSTLGSSSGTVNLKNLRNQDSQKEFRIEAATVSRESLRNFPRTAAANTGGWGPYGEENISLVIANTEEKYLAIYPRLTLDSYESAVRTIDETLGKIIIASNRIVLSKGAKANYLNLLNQLDRQTSRDLLIKLNHTLRNVSLDPKGRALSSILSIHQNLPRFKGSSPFRYFLQNWLSLDVTSAVNTIDAEGKFQVRSAMTRAYLSTNPPMSEAIEVMVASMGLNTSVDEREFYIQQFVSTYPELVIANPNSNIQKLILRQVARGLKTGALCSYAGQLRTCAEGFSCGARNRCIPAVGVGQACDGNQTVACASGLGCIRPPGLTRGPGTCKASLSVGENCGTANEANRGLNCSAGARCSDPLNLNGTCLRILNVNDSCTGQATGVVCADNLFCSTTIRTCQAKAVTNTSCSGGTPCLNSNNRCLNNICRAPSGLNGWCGDGTGCDGDLDCVISVGSIGSCQNKLPTGSACGAGRPGCLLPAKCDNGINLSGTCVAPIRAGQACGAIHPGISCSQGLNCIKGISLNGTCLAPSGRGGACSVDSSGPKCMDTFHCDTGSSNNMQGTCVSSIVKGGECGITHPDIPCADDLTCSISATALVGTCQGAIAPGAACGASYPHMKCSLGSCRILAGALNGACPTTVRAGSACGVTTPGNVCEDGSHCDAMVGASGICQLPGNVGSTCGAGVGSVPCRKDLDCEKTTLSLVGFCTQRLGVGSSCGLINPNVKCQEHLFCDIGATSIVGSCVARTGAGQTCRPSIPCVTGYNCNNGVNPTGSCVLPIGLYQSCNQFGQGGVLCVEGASCVQGLCYPNIGRRNESPCLRNDQCSSNYCQSRLIGGSKCSQ